MFKLFSLVVGLILPTVMFSQHPCYDFGKNAHSNSLKVGVGKFFNMSTDNDGNAFTTIFIETDIDNWGGGLQTDIRIGDNYINRITPSPKYSIDTRIVGYNKFNPVPNSQLGGFFQLNSTAMWLDGWQVGGLVRYQLETKRIGFLVQGQLPIYGMQRRALNIDDIERSNVAVGVISQGIDKTRRTEYRIMAGLFVKLTTPSYEYPQRRNQKRR